MPGGFGTASVVGWAFLVGIELGGVAFRFVQPVGEAAQPDLQAVQFTLLEDQDVAHVVLRFFKVGELQFQSFDNVLLGHGAAPDSAKTGSLTACRPGRSRYNRAMDITLPSFEDVREAVARLEGQVHRTPVLESTELSRRLGASVVFKCENLQRVGAFKARGAANAVLALSAAAAGAGVATHSSGNHAAALARAARARGVPAYVVMPANAPAVKRAAVLGFGATVLDCEPTLAAREAMAAELVARTGASFVHPYDDPYVIAGQGTATVEFASQVAALDTLLVPVGGGGLLSGTALAARALWPGTRVIGAEPAGAADAAASFAAGRRLPAGLPRTIADGLRGELSDRTFALINRDVDDIVTVSEAGIIEAMRLVWHYLKVVIEPSAAVPVAAFLESPAGAFGARAGVILSGGNVDFAAIAALLADHGAGH